MRLRASRRLPCRFPTRVEGPQGEIEVVVVDVTDLGAKIDGLVGLPPGASCRLRILNDAVPAVVRWCAGGSAGVTFERPLTPRQLDVVRHRRTVRADAERGGHTARHTHGFTELR